MNAAERAEAIRISRLGATNHGMPWSQEDERRVIAIGRPHDIVLAGLIGRTLMAIWSRRNQLHGRGIKPGRYVPPHVYRTYTRAPFQDSPIGMRIVLLSHDIKAHEGATPQQMQTMLDYHMPFEEKGMKKGTIVDLPRHYNPCKLKCFYPGTRKVLVVDAYDVEHRVTYSEVATALNGSRVRARRAA